MKSENAALAAALILASGPALAGHAGGCRGGGHGGGVPLALLESSQPNPRFTAEELAHPWGWLHRLFGKKDEPGKKQVSEQPPAQRFVHN